MSRALSQVWAVRSQSGKRQQPAGDGWPGSSKTEPDLYSERGKRHALAHPVNLYSPTHNCGYVGPTILLFSSENTQFTLLPDTGASRNIIKENFLPPDADILRDDILKLKGIGEGVTYTLGYINIPTFGVMTTFLVVPSKSPITQSGILSADFFKDNSAKINFSKYISEIHGVEYSFYTRETIAFSAGEKKLLFVRVDNAVDEGYTPYLTYNPENITIGPSLVKNQDGKGYFYVTNTYDHTIELEIPVVNLTPAAAVDKQIYKEILKNTPLVSQNFGHSRSHPRIIERINDEKENEPRHVSLHKSLSYENTVLTISEKSLETKNRPFACPIDLDRPVTNPIESRNVAVKTNEKSLIKEREKEPALCPVSPRNIVAKTSEKSFIKEKEKESALCSVESRNLVVGINEKSLIKEKQKEPALCPVSPRNIVAKTSEKLFIKEKQKEPALCPVESRNLVVGTSEESVIKGKGKEPVLCPVESRNVVAKSNEKSFIQEKEKESILYPFEPKNLVTETSEQPLFQGKEREPVQCPVEFKNVVINQKEKINVIEPSPFTHPVKSKKVVANTSGEIKKETELIEYPFESENIKSNVSQQIDRPIESEKVVARINVKSLVEEKKCESVSLPFEIKNVLAKKSDKSFVENKKRSS